MSLASAVRRNDPSIRSWESRVFSGKRPSSTASNTSTSKMPLPVNEPFAEHVLVGVGHRLRIGVDAREARVHVGEAATVGTRERHADPRLNQAVALAYASSRRRSSARG